MALDARHQRLCSDRRPGVGDHRVVFNIGGNKFRLVVLCLLTKGRPYVRFVGTHTEYDRIDARSV